MLPTCPACKQSVLDDDAVDCPFCGANMKTGKPGKGKTASAPSKPAGPAAKPGTSASKPGASGSKPPASSSKPSSSRKASSFDDDDDDPFSEPEDDPFTAAAKEEAANKANAIAVSPKKGKTNTIEIKCPMCESVGFVPETAAGKDVKCYNPKCSMPNFLAPKRFAPPLPTVAPKPVKEKSNSKLPVILALLGGVCLVAVVGAVAYFWDNSPKEPEGTDFKKLVAESSGGGAKKPKEEGPDPSQDPGQATTVASANAEAVAVKGPDVPALLDFMQLLSSEDRIPQNKMKCRRLMAVTYAVMHDTAGVERQFETLDTLDKRQGTFKIPGLLAIGWNQLEAGDKAGALASAEKAMAQQGNSSRETQEPMMELASLLAALGKVKEAQQVLSNRLPVDQNTPLVVAVAAARQRHDYDLTQELPGKTQSDDRPWAQLGVTLILASRGHWSESLQWAEAISDGADKTDCLLAWADARTRAALASKTVVDPSVEEIAAKLSPSARIILFGRLALTHAEANSTAEAERLIKAGQEAMKAVPAPAPARAESFKEVLDWKTPAILPLKQAVLGTALIGQAQGKLKQSEAGWLTTLDALKLARAIAPSPDAIAEIQRSTEELGVTNLRAKIRMLLNLRTENDAVKKTSDLMENVRKLTAEAYSRYQLQEAVLIAATHANMAAAVWKEVISLSQRSDPNTREPFAYGPLAGHLRHQLEKDGKTEELTELKAKLEDAKTPFDEVYNAELLVESSLTKDKFGDVIHFANQNKLSPAIEGVILKSFIQAAKIPELGVATLNFVEQIDLKANPSLNMIKLEGFRMTAAHLARRGQAGPAKDAIQLQHTSPLEKISGFLGVLEGYMIWQREHPPAPVPAKPAA